MLGQHWANEECYLGWVGMDTILVGITVLLVKASVLQVKSIQIYACGEYNRWLWVVSECHFSTHNSCKRVNFALGYAPVTLTVMTRMVIYDARIMIYHDIILVVCGRATLQAFANLGEPQQYLLHQRPQRAWEIMKLSSNPAAIRSYRTQLWWNREEP